jgi:hypothetical protein
VAIDLKQWYKKRNSINTKSIIDHTKEWLIMALLSAPSGVIFTFESKLIWWKASPLSSLMIMFFLWVFVDGFFNVFRKKNFFFTGSGESTGANTDKFLKHLPTWLQVIIKVGGMITFITLYIYSK